MQQQPNAKPIVYAILAAGFVVASAVCFATALTPRPPYVVGHTVYYVRPDEWLWAIAWGCAVVGVGLGGLAVRAVGRPREPGLSPLGIP